MMTGQASANPCQGEALGSATVKAVEGRTLKLDDDRLILLAAIDVPLSGTSGAARQGGGTAGYLASVVGRSVILNGDRAAKDRYGRIPAFVSIDRGLEPTLQHDMLKQGLARVAGAGASRSCLLQLMRLERQARTAALGLWGTPEHVVLPADNPAAVSTRRGSFALVEGRVLSVREAGSTIYANFGRRWSEDFTVTIAKRHERAFSAAGLDPRRLDHRDVRVRGWVEERGGPWIDATHPGQIEIVGED
jgi:endonuclease YncB( thermonuclease family)